MKILIAFAFTVKVLYTFDDQNKTNCLARWPHVLQVQTVAMDETTSIGVMELKTCIQAIVQCSPELVARLGQDYTVYAYDYSEYDNPLVGQGMLSWALSTASTSPDVPAHQSTKLVTGRVCKNIMGLFSNGVKETLEVKLRLVPVPTVLQSEYMSTMEKYRELSKVMPAGFDPNEWSAFLQSNPSLGQVANKVTPAPSQPIQHQNQHQRDGSSMELFNQLLSPSLEQQTAPNAFNQPPPISNTSKNGNGNESQTDSAAPGKKGSRATSRPAVKRPRKPRQSKKVAPKGGNTSGYEEGTDGDDGPQPKKRAKITKADWNSKSTIGTAPDSLRVAASTAGSLRAFRPLAMSPVPGPGGHLQEIPRAPTPVPPMMNNHSHPEKRPAPARQMSAENTGPSKAASQEFLRRNSFHYPLQLDAPRRHVSPYPPIEHPEDQPRYSIESANVSPERNSSPSDTPPGIGSSPPIMRTRPPSLRSSPPCPSSPVLPQMPRTDSGFMSGTLDDLFGEDYDEPMQPSDDDMTRQAVPDFQKHMAPEPVAPHQDSSLYIEEEQPGPMELLPTRMNIQPVPARAASKSRASSKTPKPRAGSVMSEDGHQTLPPLRRDSPAITHPHPLSQPPNNQRSNNSRPGSRGSQGKSPVPQRPNSQPVQQGGVQSRPGSRGSQGKTPPPPKENSQPPEPEVPAQIEDQAIKPPPAPRSRPSGRTMSRTASMGSLTLPTIPTSDPVLPPSNLHRSQTWSEAPHPASEAPMPTQTQMSNFPQNFASQDADSGTYCKKASIRNKLEMAIAKGEMPPFCGNCGAIETSTWRKAWSQNHDGIPGYHEYSEAAGRVTCITILTRDDDDQPTSYQIVKKALGKDEVASEYNEFLLCNRKCRNLGLETQY